MSSLPAHYINGTRLYIIAWTGIALTASIGTLYEYWKKGTSTQVFGWCGAVVSFLIMLSLVLEGCLHRRSGPNASADNVRLSQFMSHLHKHNIPNRAMHVATQLLSICSVALASVYLHTENYSWSFGFCVALLGMVFVYNVMYLPSNILDVALFHYMTPEHQLTIETQFQATPFIWKNAYVDTRLLPSTT